MESSVHTNKSNKTKDSINNATNYLQSLPPDEEKALKLGLVSRPLTTTNASLDPDVLVMSGVIPCIPAPLELHIFNASDHYVKISKSTVIAEVYLLDPTDYNQPITEIKEYELPQEGPAKVQRSTVQNYPEKSSFNRLQPDPDFSPTELRKEQLLDPDLMIIVMAVEDNKRPDFQEIVGCSPKTRSLWLQFNSLIVHNGLLYRKAGLLVGAPMRTPLDLKLGLPPTTNQEVNPDHYPFWLRQTLSNIHDQVRENLQDSALRMKRHYDLHASVAPFQVGQLVWFYNRKRIKGKSPKLDTPWEGPYKIVKILNDCIAAIQSCHNSQLTRIVHMDKLASYSQPLDSVQAAWLTIVQSPWQQTTTSQSSIHPLTLQVPVEEIPLPPA
ncbi:putative Brix domain-containing ribosomal biogenesis protein [Frankliniella fusca]|uniref:Brix domain-containing ribosomal biogenesis protein n=1 Tax=Frankliniella fusca TaxID=407009 RepID=A0AAE1GWZ4_9NEOP|nr:putative Brix domain-containing ribosomal biogenesis protein [Frankliniella fusca]